MSKKQALEALKQVGYENPFIDGSESCIEHEKYRQANIEIIKAALTEEAVDIELEKLDEWIVGLTVGYAKDNASALRNAAVGKPAKIKWPHKVLHDGAETIDSLLQVIENQAKGMIRPVEQPTGYKLMLDYFRAKEEHLSHPSSGISISTPEGRKLSQRAGELFNIALDHLASKGIIKNK